jgi:hypothetical protein
MIQTNPLMRLPESARWVAGLSRKHCAYGGPIQASYSATIRLTHYRILESPRLDKHAKPAPESGQVRLKAVNPRSSSGLFYLRRPRRAANIALGPNLKAKPK